MQTLFAFDLYDIFLLQYNIYIYINMRYSMFPEIARALSSRLRLQNPSELSSTICIAHDRTARNM